jgi:hypothetical protein
MQSRAEPQRLTKKTSPALTERKRTCPRANRPCCSSRRYPPRESEIRGEHWLCWKRSCGRSISIPEAVLKSELLSAIAGKPPTRSTAPRSKSVSEVWQMIWLNTRGCSTRDDNNGDDNNGDDSSRFHRSHFRSNRFHSSRFRARLLPR